MSLPVYSAQAELFSMAALSGQLFEATDRYRMFAQKVYPALAAIRSQLEACYCADNGRVAVEPVLLLGVSLLQYLEAAPDRQAVDMLHYHAGWNFALNRQVGDPLFHPTTLVNFRQRLVDNNLSTIGFETVLEVLIDAGLVARQSRQRLDSTQMFGLVSRMSRLDCVRESLRMALKELAEALKPEARPLFWGGLWERYVESQTDYRASSETLSRKLEESGADAWLLLEWLREPRRSLLAAGPQARLLGRVFAEQFEIRSGTTTPAAREKVVVAVNDTTKVSVEDVPFVTGNPEVGQTQNPVQTDNKTLPPMTTGAAVAPTPAASAPSVVADSATGQPQEDPTQGPAQESGAVIRLKDNKELASDRVQNPHDPDATYAAKGEGEKKKEHVGYKVQVAETVSQAVLAPGEPTCNFICGIVTHAARESDEEGSLKMEIEQQDMGLDKPPVQYVDAAYISTQELMKAQEEGRELIGPAPGASRSEGRFCSDHFSVMVEQRKAICPAGHENSQCSRLEERTTGKVSYRFEWSTSACGNCPLRPQCMKTDQKHRTLVVGEHHTILQERRREQKTEAFKERMKHRNAIEGTQSELVRAHGLRRARYRGLPKAGLQNYFAAAACNIKRWLRRAAWELKTALTAQLSSAAAH